MFSLTMGLDAVRMEGAGLVGRRLVGHRLHRQRNLTRMVGVVDVVLEQFGGVTSEKESGMPLK
jgi:hypothetical protein